MVQQDCKFVSPRRANGEGFPLYAPRYLLTANTSPNVGHTNQQLIPNQVSHAVINHLEPIKIHKENREQLIIVTLRTF